MLAGVHAVLAQVEPIWSVALVELLLFPLASTPMPVMAPEHDSPTCLLFWIVTRLRVVGPLAGRASTLIPPYDAPAGAVPGPFPVMVVFLISKAAPLNRMPPPGLLMTAQVSMWRVVPVMALIPMPVAGLAVP